MTRGAQDGQELLRVAEGQSRRSAWQPCEVLIPKGFVSHVANVGIKDDTLDFMLVASKEPASAAGVFTRNRFAGPCVALSRANVAGGRLSAIVAVSKNANVAVGDAGRQDAEAVVAAVASLLGVEQGEVAMAATGVIGRRLPVEKVVGHVSSLAARGSGVGVLGPLDLEAAATAIMTTDTVPKIAARKVRRASEAVVAGIAKGVGMIAPDMATLLAFFFTDALVDASVLDTMFRRVVDATFNCLTIDGDTSTSDSAIVMANGMAGPVGAEELESALGEVALDLVKQIARDGEGATKLLEVRVDGARDHAQARRVARLVADSPLVKTAVHGADPNWGRVAMAVGKAQDDMDIDPDRTVIRFAGQEVYPRRLDERGLASLAERLRGESVTISIDLGCGQASATVWGCDLSAEYVRINADYTT